MYHLLQLRCLILQLVDRRLHFRLLLVVHSYPRYIHQAHPKQVVNCLVLPHQSILQGEVKHLVLEVEGLVGMGLDECPIFPQLGDGCVVGDGVQES